VQHAWRNYEEEAMQLRGMDQRSHKGGGVCITHGAKVEAKRLYHGARGKEGFVLHMAQR